MKYLWNFIRLSLILRGGGLCRKNWLGRIKIFEGDYFDWDKGMFYSIIVLIRIHLKN